MKPNGLPVCFGVADFLGFALVKGISTILIGMFDSDDDTNPLTQPISLDHFRNTELVALQLGHASA